MKGSHIFWLGLSVLLTLMLPIVDSGMFIIWFVFETASTIWAVNPTYEVADTYDNWHFKNWYDFSVIVNIYRVLKININPYLDKKIKV